MIKVCYFLKKSILLCSRKDYDKWHCGYSHNIHRVLVNVGYPLKQFLYWYTVCVFICSTLYFYLNFNLKSLKLACVNLKYSSLIWILKTSPSHPVAEKTLMTTAAEQTELLFDVDMIITVCLDSGLDDFGGWAGLRLYPTKSWFDDGQATTSGQHPWETRVREKTWHRTDRERKKERRKGRRVGSAGQVGFSSLGTRTVQHKVYFHQKASTNTIQCKGERKEMSSIVVARYVALNLWLWSIYSARWLNK